MSPRPAQGASLVPYSTLNASERAERLDAARSKGGHAAIAKVRKEMETPWPPVEKLTWEQRLNGRRFDEPGMVVRFKGEIR